MREDDGGEDHDTAENLNHGKTFVQEEPARKNGKDRFKPEDERGIGGRGVLLCPDLKCVAQAQREDGGIADGEEQAGVEDRKRLDDHAEGEVEQSADEELPDRKGECLEGMGIFAEDNDVKCPEQGADELQQVAELDCIQLAAGGEEEGARHGEDDGDDEEPMRSFAPKEEEQNGNQDNI